jgi:DNA-binding beta-propeller fold protein YncE
LTVLAALVLASASGCASDHSMPELVWGRKGVQPGDLVRPRAIAIDGQDHLYIVDFTARIQVYDRDGHYLDCGWTTPDYRNGRPSGLAIGHDGNILVCDSHYHCVRVYSPAGNELRVLGSEKEPYHLAYVTDVVQDAEGYYYLSEFGENQRITKLDPDGRLVTRWGRMGTEPGEFQRIRALALGPDKKLYVADACNHRIQVFDRQGKYLRQWGTPGTGPGEMRYPYDLAFDRDGDLFVVEYGNHRVQKFTAQGESLGCWGSSGRESGCLNCPWALAVDSQGCVHVLDSENHRVQRIKF